MSDWQTMETAPRTGERIRVKHELDPTRDDVFAEWNGEAWRMSEFFIDPRTFYMYTQPTHWRPQEPSP